MPPTEREAMPGTQILVRPSVFPPGIIAGSSTRRGGVSPHPLGMNLSYRVGDSPANVRANRERFFGALGIRLDELAIPGQVHGDRVLYADHPGDYPDCDGLITSLPRLFLCVTTADCVPILLADPNARLCAAVHAGWRGTVSQILTRTLDLLFRRGASPRHLFAFLGPSAGSCCYQVGPEVASHLESRFLRSENGNLFADLGAANEALLTDAGIPPAQIERDSSCTICTPGKFHSFRREAAHAGRMMGVIGFGD